MTTQLVSLSESTLLGLFNEALEGVLVERGRIQIPEMLGPESDFWVGCSEAELLRMSDGGNAQAQAELAWRYVVGRGVAKSTQRALQWATRSADRDCPAGLAVLGWLLYQGQGVPEDHEEAVRLFERAARTGDARGSTWLGLCFLRGHGVARNPMEAITHLRWGAGIAEDRVTSKVSGQASSLASYWLGRIAYFGLPSVCVPDHVIAVERLALAARYDQPRAKELLARCYFFGRGVALDQGRAYALWCEAAEEGVVAACYCAGMCLYVGVGCEVDHVAAVRFFRAAARRALPGAMFLLGQCYMFGKGVTQDESVGMAWYRRASEQGSRDADFELGECAAHGITMAADMGEAARCWRRAARLGHGRAYVKLGHCYRWGEGVAFSPVRAVICYRRGMTHGEVGAAVWLGECAERGEGLPHDALAAVNFYRNAATRGNAHGMAELGRCLLHGVGGRRSRREGASWLQRAAELGWETALGELQRYWFDRADALSLSHTHAGRGVRVAAQLYARAAALGHEPSALRFGQCLRSGRGVERSPTDAVLWFSKAAALLDAKLALADMLHFGETGEIRHTEALHWYVLAAEQGEDAYAMYSAGYCLLHGLGASVDEVRGVAWLTEAARRGDAEAQFELGCFYTASDNEKMQRWFESAAALGHTAALERLHEMQTLDAGG
jgi:TPR repeat protein